MKSLKEKSECDIKLCIQNDDDIVLYYIHQSFIGDEPIWSVIKENRDVWRLSEEVLKLKRDSINTAHQLVKKPNETV